MKSIGTPFALDALLLLLESLLLLALTKLVVLAAEADEVHQLYLHAVCAQ